MPLRRADAVRRGSRPWVFLAGLLLSSCLFETSAPEPGWRHQLHYIVDIGGSGKVHCRVRVRVARWPTGEPLLFQAPPYYTDNPAMPLSGFTAKDFSAEDSTGAGVVVRDTAPGLAGLDGNFIVAPPGTRTLTYFVDHDTIDPGRFGLPLPGLGPGVQAIDGAYFFVLPVVGRERSAQWREPVSLSLEFKTDPGYRLVGHDAVSAPANNYELMFVRAVVNPLRTSGFRLGNLEVTTYAATADTFDIGKYDTLLETCVRLVQDSLLPLPATRWFAGEMPIFWGIEGTQGYWFRPEAQSMAQVHTHEFIHTFVGVRHGDLDDPWWKEGVTNYLGELLPVQAGIYPESLFSGDVLAPRDSLPAVQDYALASPYVRDHLFPALDTAYRDGADPKNFIGLVYGKGGQAAMILDRYLLESSLGKKSLFDLVRALAARGPAFARADLVSTVSVLAGRDARAFVESLLDRPGAFPADSLKRTYDALKARGRFAPGAPAVAKPAASSTPRSPANQAAGPPPGSKL